ncbi:MAG: S8 family serine peptidase [bacterium]|nr:S8 family serine peptidase [bacterium]
MCKVLFSKSRFVSFCLVLFLFSGHTPVEASKTVVLTSDSYKSRNDSKAFFFSKGNIDTLMPDMKPPFYALSATFIVEYEATCLTPAAPCSIKAIWHGMKLSGLSAKECSLFIWSDASGHPGTRLFSLRSLESGTGSDTGIYSYTLPTPIYVSGPFWVGNYEWSLAFPTTAVDKVPSAPNKWSTNGATWQDDIFDYFHAAVVKYEGEGTPDISVNPTSIMLQIDSSKGSYKASPTPMISENDEKYWKDIVSGEILIGYKSSINVKNAKLNELGIAEKGINLVNKELGSNFILVKIPSGIAEAKAFIARMKANPDVKSVEPNRIVKILGTPNDPYWSQLWHMDNLNVPAAWGLNGWGSYAISIAIIDEGTEYFHPDLVSRFGAIKGRDIVDSDDDPRPSGSDEDHGTFCSGLAAATINNGIGVAGVSNAHLYAIRALNGGVGGADAVGQSIQWCIDHKVNLISMSLGYATPSSYVEAECQAAWDSGAVLCAATGNGGTEGVGYPAAYSTVIAVGAIEPNNQRCSFSTYGNEVELVAPGDTITSTIAGGAYQGTWNGTSMATPLVAGGAALVWAANPYLTNQEVRDILTSTAIDLGTAGRDKYYGYGKPNIQAAVQAALNNNTLPADTGTITVSNSGSAGGDLNVTDISYKAQWIRSVIPRNFTVIPGSSQAVTVIAQAKLPKGYYYDTLHIASNDSTYKPYLVPITLKVGNPGIEDNTDYGVRNADLDVSPSLITRLLSVKFAIFTSQRISLKIYDAAGRVVKTIFDGNKTAGNYSLTVNMCNINSGIYFVVLQQENTRISKKVSLIK